MNSRAARWRAGDGPKAFTRRWKRKEGVPIQKENQTLASITFQNYFRLYEKLSGMTGTADTEAYEFQSIYGLEVVVIPTHKDMIRDDRDDLVFLKSEAKFDAIIDDIRDCTERRQPVLVGTTSIETSELISGLLKKRKIQHEVLNAKQHEREALIVAQAGRPGSVTIATNMAGRGTDIVLGGNLAAELADLGEDAPEDQKEALKAEWQKRHDQVIEAGGSAHHSVPSATNRGVSTISCAAARGARATRVHHASICRWKTI